MEGRSDTQRAAKETIAWGRAVLILDPDQVGLKVLILGTHVDQNVAFFCLLLNYAECSSTQQTELEATHHVTQGATCFLGWLDHCSRANIHNVTNLSNI